MIKYSKQKMAEKGSTMAGHSLAITIVAYVVLMYVFKVEQPKAEDNGILVGALALVYMLVFGHSLPSCKTMNPNLYIKGVFC
jgi:hypothetical protein